MSIHHSRNLAPNSWNGTSLLAAALSVALCVCARYLSGAGRAETSTSRTLRARTFNSGFPQAHDSFNGMLAASDGRVYYVLSSESVDVGAQMFSYDPSTRRIEHLGDLTQACGEAGQKTIVQGKSHVNFVECEGKLYFATHMGYYSIVQGIETPGVPPPGYQHYPGGHFLAFDLASRKYEDFGIPAPGEGIISMTMDTRRRRLYGLTWPSGSFLRFDLVKREAKNFGPVAGRGEAGRGQDYRTVCRSLVVDPEDGSVYFSTADGWIMRYSLAQDSLQKIEGDDLKKDYFGSYDPTSPGTMGYNWRQTVWYAPERAIYGIHGNSGYLFRFDPRQERVEILQRLTSEASQRRGMFDQFSYGYLGFRLGPDGHTLYYLTGGPSEEHGNRAAGQRRAAKGESLGIEDLHLVTFDIPAQRYIDHGAILCEDGGRPQNAQSIAVDQAGTVYTLARFTDHGKSRVDLVSIPGPFETK